MLDGAQGRNRTTDTAIFSRMLYQLSYLGTSKASGAWERAVYSQAGRACPPCFACLSGIARRATTDGYARRGLASSRPQTAGKSCLFGFSSRPGAGKVRKPDSQRPKSTPHQRPQFRPQLSTLILAQGRHGMSLPGSTPTPMPRSSMRRSSRGSRNWARPRKARRRQSSPPS